MLGVLSEHFLFLIFDLSVCSNNPSVSHSLDSSLYTRELCWWMFVRIIDVKPF